MQQNLVDEYNASQGDLKGYDCSVCNNKGFSQFFDGENIVNRQCECTVQRRALKNISKSGLTDVMSRYTFKDYIISSSWQRYAKEKALDYVKQNGKWFFIGGQSGAGKTHLCTAICSQMLKQGKTVRYMLWVTEIRNLKSVANDEAYNSLFDSFAHADVLYIDDLFKVKKGIDKRSAELTSADVQRTYELINYRYNTNRKTIISSEKSIDEIIDIDEAIGGRIKEMANGYILELGQDSNMNWRLR